MGRLDQLVDDAGHQRGARARHARRPDGVRVRLDVEPGQRPEGDPGQRDRAPEPRPPGGRGRPRSGRRRREPRLRAPRVGLRRRVRGVPQDHAQRAQQDQERLPAHLRHDRLHRELPARGLRRSRCRRCDLRHGLRLPDVRLVERRVHRPAVRSQVRPHRHRPRLHGARQALPPDPRPAVVRARLVHDLRRRPGDHPERREVRLQHGRQLRERHGSRARARAALGSRGAEPVRRLPPPELHRHLRLRDQLAPGLLRRPRLAEGAAGDGQRVRPAGCRHLGPGVRRRPPGAVPRLRGVIPGGQVRPPGRHRAALDRPARRGLRGHVGGQGREQRRELRRAGLGQRRRLDHLAERDPGHLRRLAGQGRHRLCVPRPGPGQQGQHRRLQRDLHLGPDAGPGRRRLRTRGHGRPVLPDGSRHVGRQARDPGRGHDRRRHAGPGEPGRRHVVRGHPAHPGVEPGHLRGARRLGRHRLVRHDARQGLPRAQQHAGGRRARRPGLRA